MDWRYFFIEKALILMHVLWKCNANGARWSYIIQLLKAKLKCPPTFTRKSWILLNSMLSVYISREKLAGMILIPRWRTDEPQFCAWNLHLLFGVYPHTITDCSSWWQNCSTAIHVATVMSQMLGARESHFARVYTMQQQLPRHFLLQQHNGATMHHKREIGSKVIQLHWNTPFHW